VRNLLRDPTICAPGDPAGISFVNTHMALLSVPMTVSPGFRLGYFGAAIIVIWQTAERTPAMLDESLLRGLPPFSQLSKAEIREILEHAVSRRYETGTSIFCEGHDADRFYLLLDGYLRVVRTSPDGDEIIVLHISPGQLFGIAPALQRDTYPATSIAAAESIALSWPVSLWDHFISTYEGFATETYKTVGKRLGQVQVTLTEMATKAVEKRVASAVLRLANQSGRKVAQGIEIAFPVTRQNIADMTGTTLHTVSRLLSAWQKDGMVLSTRKNIIVTDPHRLFLMSGATS
jgi:CRP-like cAMP-binding protein